MLWQEEGADAYLDKAAGGRMQAPGAISINSLLVLEQSSLQVKVAGDDHISMAVGEEAHCG